MPSDHDPKQLLLILEQAAKDLPYLLTSGPMFGGIMAYADAKPFCSLSNVGVALKLSPEQNQALRAIEGAKALQYEPTMPPSKTYTIVPEAFLEGQPAELTHWCQESMRFVAATKKN